VWRRASVAVPRQAGADRRGDSTEGMMIYLLIGGVVALFVYEFWAAANKQSGDTISEIVWRASRKPILPFAFGVLMGHFFW
jgi:hypothetical protein